MSFPTPTSHVPTQEEIRERKAKAVVRWNEAIQNLNSGIGLRPAFIRAQEAVLDVAEQQINHLNKLLAAAA